MDKYKIGKAIAYLRRRAGYTQKDLANRLNVACCQGMLFFMIKDGLEF